ncbi:MAG: M15 family metallopeptidase [Acidimicrobiia bacterium]
MNKAVVMGTLVFVFIAVLSPRSAEAIGGEGEAWPSFNESSSCGAQRVITAHANETGGLSGDSLLRGEFAAMFGRTVSQVQQDLVPWTIPGSDKTLAVHTAILPALKKAEADLRVPIVDEGAYRIDGSSTFSAAARTIGGTLRTSRHTYGIAFDVNSRRNPFRADNELVTDLPQWWVQSFLDAGFCWGGMWIGSKDPMHFAWQGPKFSGYNTLPSLYEPLTDPIEFSAPSASTYVVPKSPPGTLVTVLGDQDGNGALDVIRVVDGGQDLRLEASLAARRHNACSVRTIVVSGLGGVARRSVALGFGDWDGRGGQDLWIATDDGGSLRLTVRWAFGGYSAETSVVTDVPTPSGSAWISTGDYNTDGSLELFVADGGQLTIWALDPNTGMTTQLLTVSTPFGEAEELFLGDYDLDTRPDLWAITEGSLDISLAAGGYASVVTSDRPIGLPLALEDVRAADYDGDGRTDLVTFDGISKQVWLGNTQLEDGLSLEVWFENENLECEEGEVVSIAKDLLFTSSDSIAEGSYEWRVANGFATGCDPHDDGCDPGLVNRQMFNEFLAWIDGLVAVPGNEALSASRALLRAGYAVPCSASDSECWDTPMLRSEVASLFGQFLAQRRGDVPAPHRWVLPAVTYVPEAQSPS